MPIYWLQTERRPLRWGRMRTRPPPPNRCIWECWSHWWYWSTLLDEIFQTLWFLKKKYFLGKLSGLFSRYCKLFVHKHERTQCYYFFTSFTSLLRHIHVFDNPFFSYSLKCIFLVKNSTTENWKSP